jgi:hypothetical protein
MPPKRPATTKAGKKTTKEAASKTKRAQPQRNNSDHGQASSGPAVENVAVAEGSGRVPKRRQGRRDSDDAVERIIEEKLVGKFSQEAIHGTTNKDGLSVHEFIAQANDKIRGTGKKLATAFWTSFFQQFTLSKKECDELPDPDPTEEAGAPVLEAMSYCHDSNPAIRSVEPLLSHLRSCEPLKYVEMFGVIQGCQESPKVVKSQYWRVMQGLLGCITRSSTLEAYCCFIAIA